MGVPDFSALVDIFGEGGLSSAFTVPLGIVGIILGVGMGTFGYKMWKYTIFILGFLIIGFPCALIGAASGVSASCVVDSTAASVNDGDLTTSGCGGVYLFGALYGIVGGICGGEHDRLQAFVLAAAGFLTPAALFSRGLFHLLVLGGHLLHRLRLRHDDVYDAGAPHRRIQRRGQRQRD